MLSTYQKSALIEALRAEIEQLRAEIKQLGDAWNDACHERNDLRVENERLRKLLSDAVLEIDRRKAFDGKGWD